MAVRKRPQAVVTGEAEHASSFGPELLLHASFISTPINPERSEDSPVLYKYIIQISERAIDTDECACGGIARAFVNASVWSRLTRTACPLVPFSLIPAFPVL